MSDSSVHAAHTMGGKSLRILVADDHELVRRGIRVVVENHPGWEICGEADNGSQTIDLAKQLKPNVLVLDITMPVLSGLEVLGKIRQVAPETEVLVLTAHDSEEMIRDILAAGGRGILLKTDAAPFLTLAIETVSQHKPFFTGRISELVLRCIQKPAAAPVDEAVAVGTLTVREHEIVRLLAEGNTSKDVAVTLGISAKTVDSHRMNIMHKLGFRSVTELVRFAVRNKIIEA